MTTGRTSPASPPVRALFPASPTRPGSSRSRSSTRARAAASLCPLAYFSDILAGLNFAYNDRGIGTVSVNISIGGGSFTSNCDAAFASIKTAIDNLRSVNIATAIASGNTGFTNAVSFPACISTALTIGATDNSDAVANFSNSSAQVDFYAPGVCV